MLTWTSQLSSFLSLVFPSGRDSLCKLGSARAWLNADTTTSLPPWLAPDYETELLRRFGTSEALTAALNYYRSVFTGAQAENAAWMTLEDFVLRVPVMTAAGASDAVSSPEEVQEGTRPWMGAEYPAEVMRPAIG